MTRNRIIILASFGLIFITTLFPFNFTLRGRVLSWNALALPPGREGKWEILANVLLYLPFGRAITAYFFSRRLQIYRTLVLVLVICFTISYVCEVLQFFLPSRFPSWRDVASNTMGGILGSLCVLVWAQKVSRSSCLTN
jgi:VanZ family protein